LRLKLRSLDDGGTGVDEMLVKYEQVFYAGSDPVSARDHIMRLLETGAVQ